MTPPLIREIEPTRTASAPSNRVIIHLDLDCFYAQVETVRLGISANVPLVVSQWGGILAVNYQAREFGISRHDKVADALIKCPSLYVQHVPTISSLDDRTGPQYHVNPSIHTHKASLHTYRDASSKIMSLIKNHNFTSFQKASVDEAFIDCTDQVEALISSATSVGSGLESNADAAMVDWGMLPTNSTHIISHSQDIKTHGGYRDLQLFYAAKISHELRKEIFLKLGYTASTGISHNKTLAKLVSATNKPNKQTVLLDSDVMEYMKSVPLVKIKGLGGKLGDTVVEAFKCEMAADLWPVPLTDLCRVLGNQDGKWVYEVCRGECNDLVKASALTLSMQSCKNFRSGIQDIDTLQKWVRNLSTELYHRLLQDFEETERWPRTVSVSLRCKTSSHTKQAPLPHRDYVVSADYLYAIIEVLVLEFRLVLPCYYIQLALTGLKQVDMKSKAINTYFKAVVKGSPSVKAVECVEEAEEAVSSPVRSKVTDPLPLPTMPVPMPMKELLKVIDENGVPLFWKCGECGDVFERQKRSEHMDFHFAALVMRGGGHQKGPRVAHAKKEAMLRVGKKTASKNSTRK